MTVVVGAVCMQVQILPATALAVDNRVLIAQDLKLLVQIPAELLNVTDGPLETERAAGVVADALVVEDVMPEPKVRLF